jgi:hypothetical protein
MGAGRGTEEAATQISRLLAIIRTRAVLGPVSSHSLLTFSLSLHFPNSFGPIQRHRDRREKKWEQTVVSG